MKLEFSRDIFGKKIQISNFVKISPLGAKFYHADGRKKGQTYLTREANGGLL
jgi:hypothetical protein